MKMKTMISKYLSFTSYKDLLYRYSFLYAGLRSVSSDLGDGTTIQCWIPKHKNLSKPSLLLIHGFGANAMWQYSDYLRHFTSFYNVYVPDLLFFGGSSTDSPNRSEAFQARCLMKMMETQEVRRMSLVGISYGGFVGYSMAAQFPEAVERVALCCAGVCLEEADMKEGLFKVADLEAAASILLPQTAEKLRELIRMSYYKPANLGLVMPSWILSDYIHVMCKDYLEEKKELIHQILKDRKNATIPKIRQPTLILWGEQDQIFPIELGYRLKRHIGEDAELVIIKNAGHAVNLEKPKEITYHLKKFLITDIALCSMNN